MNIVEQLKVAMKEKGYTIMTEKGSALCALANQNKGLLCLKENAIKAFLLGTSVQNVQLEKLKLTSMEVTKICL